MAGGLVGGLGWLVPSLLGALGWLVLTLLAQLLADAADVVSGRGDAVADLGRTLIDLRPRLVAGLRGGFLSLLLSLLAYVRGSLSHVVLPFRGIRVGLMGTQLRFGATDTSRVCPDPHRHGRQIAQIEDWPARRADGSPAR